jgi:hypothetical protein
MPRIFRSRWQAPAVVATLLAAFAIALIIPIPSLPDVGRAAVQTEVSERLPGWTIQRLDPSWEGGYTVVTTCAGKQVGFQFVPGHGLPAEDAWLHPSNEYARERLTVVSDHWRYLLWRADPRRPDALSCQDELARTGDEPIRNRFQD